MRNDHLNDEARPIYTNAIIAVLFSQRSRRDSIVSCIDHSFQRGFSEYLCILGKDQIISSQYKRNLVDSGSRLLFIRIHSCHLFIDFTKRYMQLADIKLCDILMESCTVTFRLQTHLYAGEARVSRIIYSTFFENKALD